jgi:hypothetical protein
MCEAYEKRTVMKESRLVKAEWQDNWLQRDMYDRHATIHDCVFGVHEDCTAIKPKTKLYLPVL